MGGEGGGGGGGGGGGHFRRKWTVHESDEIRDALHDYLVQRPSGPRCCSQKLMSPSAMGASLQNSPHPSRVQGLLKLEMTPLAPDGLQTDRQSDSQTDSQTDTFSQKAKQTDRQSDRNTFSQKAKHRQTDRQTKTHSVRRPNRKTDSQTETHSVRRPNRQTHRQTEEQIKESRHIHTWEDNQENRQTDLN